MAGIRQRVSAKIKTPSGRTWNDICSRMPIVNTSNLENLVFTKLFASSEDLRGNDDDLGKTLPSVFTNISYDQDYEEYHPTFKKMQVDGFSKILSKNYRYYYNYEYDTESKSVDDDDFINVFDPGLIRERAGIDYYPEPYCSIVEEAVGDEVTFAQQLK